MLQFTEYAQQVGLTVKQNFTGKVSSVYGSTRASSDAHRKPIEMVVIHTTANTAPAVNEAKKTLLTTMVQTHLTQ
ncbi:hypothetical protein MGH68_11880 [Erysipelothrix sp. D19-032]